MGRSKSEDDGSCGHCGKCWASGSRMVAARELDRRGRKEEIPVCAECLAKWEVLLERQFQNRRAFLDPRKTRSWW